MERTRRDQLFFFWFMPLFSLAFCIAAWLVGNPLPGLWSIWQTAAPFLTDPIATVGLSAVLFNSGTMGLLAWCALWLSQIRPTGRAFAPFFLCIGAGLLGGDLLSGLPITLGGFLYAALRKEPPAKSVLFALYGCALSPAVASFYMGLHGPTPWSIVLGLLLAVFIGFLCTPLVLGIRPLHHGFNLHSMGIPLGVISVVLYAVYRSAILHMVSWTDTQSLPLLLGDSQHAFFFPFFGLIFLALLMLGRAIHKPQDPAYKELFSHSGLEADFISLFGMANVFQNMGLMGLMFLAYFFLISAPFNGAAASALLFALCWSAAGAHPRNTAPILVTYSLMSLLPGLNLNAPELVVGVGFAVGLAPIYGRLGWAYGLLAAGLHACLMPLVLHTGGGFNLATGALATGIVALALYPILSQQARRQEESPIHTAHASVASELLHSAAHIVDGMDEALSHVADPTASATASPHKDLFLLLRNIFACIAAGLFLLTLLPLSFVSHSHVLRFAAYILGALAYGSEILALTHGFRKKQPLDEMLMPYLFGILYIALGFSYLLGH